MTSRNVNFEFRTCSKPAPACRPSRNNQTGSAPIDRATVRTTGSRRRTAPRKIQNCFLFFILEWEGRQLVAGYAHQTVRLVEFQLLADERCDEVHRLRAVHLPAASLQNRSTTHRAQHHHDWRYLSIVIISYIGRGLKTYCRIQSIRDFLYFFQEWRWAELPRPSGFPLL